MATTDTTQASNPAEPDTEDQAAAEAAFAGGFEHDDGSQPADDKPADEPKTPAAAPAAAKAPAAAPTPSAPASASAPAVDPYADFPQPVRDKLARVSFLEHQLSSLTGRFNALEKERQRLAAAPTPPAGAPAEPASARPEKARPALEKVRGELGEVADAIEEARREFADELEQLKKSGAATAAPASAAAPAAAPGAPDEAGSIDPNVALTDDEKQIAEVYPDFGDTLIGTDFNLWLDRQDKAWADKVRASSKAAVIVDAIGKFKAWDTQAREQRTAAEAEVARLKASRQQRVTGAAPAPGGRGRAPEADPNEIDPESAFVSAFEKA
jgi:hypothetical protein